MRGADRGHLPISNRIPESHPVANLDLDNLDLASLKRRRSEKWTTYPEDVLPAWVAEMDFPLAEPIRAVLEHAIAGDDLGYPRGARETGLPDLFAERMRERFG
jgi:cystathionine beta-lyase